MNKWGHLKLRKVCISLSLYFHLVVFTYHLFSTQSKLTHCINIVFLIQSVCVCVRVPFHVGAVNLQQFGLWSHSERLACDWSVLQCRLPRPRPLSVADV